MLSYQHIYHAGCLADIHKHAVLAVMLAKMAEKPKAMSYAETHAGRGWYDYSSIEAEKTGEAKAGIIKFLAEGKIPGLHPYMKVINAVQSEHGNSCYPGSAYIARKILGESSNFHLMEMHPKEYAALQQNMSGKNIHLHKRDGYAGVLALSPLQPRRGMIFIDPSYELKDEYAKMPGYIVSLHKKWPEAVILLWYPILTAALHENMREELAGQDFNKFWQQEVMFKTNAQENFMQGSGLICINTPFGIGEELAEIAGWF